MTKIVIFGTFDRLHKGHISFLSQAKNLGDYLIAVVARDKYVKSAKGGLPLENEKLRIQNLRKINLADKVILGSRAHNFYQTLRTYKPVIIALGYDQKPKIWDLKSDLKRHRLSSIKIVRLKPYKPAIYKSSKMTFYRGIFHSKIK